MFLICNRNGRAYELNNAVVMPMQPHTKFSRTGRKNYRKCHRTTKMFQHDCNAILYNSSSINKKLKLSDLHFRHNIDCFGSISLMKIVPIKVTAELCVSECYVLYCSGKDVFSLLLHSHLTGPVIGPCFCQSSILRDASRTNQALVGT